MESIIKAKWAGKCEFCGSAVKAGSDCTYNADTKKVRHTCCTRNIKGTSGKKVKGGEYAHEFGTSAVINMDENQHDRFIVRVTFTEYGNTYTRHAGGHCTGPIKKELAEQSYTNALVKLAEMGFTLKD